MELEARLGVLRGTSSRNVGFPTRCDSGHIPIIPVSHGRTYPEFSKKFGELV
jgi:hypothetical protein